jgi:hypothetical protein
MPQKPGHQLNGPLEASIAGKMQSFAAVEELLPLLRVEWRKVYLSYGEVGALQATAYSV